MGTGIVRGLAYCGRLLKEDGRPVPAGRYTLRLSLHSDGRIGRSSWSEVQERIEVAEGGVFSVCLGASTPMESKQFFNRARWVGVRRIVDGVEEPEHTPRVCVMGTSLQLADLMAQVQTQLQAHQELLERYESGPSPRSLAQRLAAIERKTEDLESGDLGQLRAQIATLISQAESLLSEGGRLDQIEDRLEDLDGPDGDIIDVNMRMDRLESQLQPPKRKKRASAK